MEQKQECDVTILTVVGRFEALGNSLERARAIAIPVVRKVSFSEMTLNYMIALEGGSGEARAFLDTLARERVAVILDNGVVHIVFMGDRDLNVPGQV